jgi:nicotinamide mononucleotide transporter
VLYIGEYIYKHLWVTAVLYAVLVILAILGLRDWRRAARSAQTADCTTLSSGSPAI